MEMGILKNKFQKKIMEVPRWVWIFVLIIAVGIFLRTFEFTDWLRFSPDQARDAMLAQDVLAGKAPLPLIGPQAGNTMFSLGPLYYYVQILSAKIFGVSPQALAYPDLLLSILAIPLLYYFLKIYFSRKISLMMTALMSVSYFAIINSRFASNPNTIPFFVLLFLLGCIGMLSDENQKGKWYWPIAVGIAMGVSSQLHTLLLLGMPVVIIAVCLWLLLKRRLQLKAVVLIILSYALLNGGMIIYEYRNNASNTKALISGITSHSSGESKLLDNIGLISSCQLQANSHIISGLSNIETCGGMFKYAHQIKTNKTSAAGLIKSGTYILNSLVAIIFTLGGIYIGFKRYRKEKDFKKKCFLMISTLFSAVLLLVFVPAAGEVSMRYFIVLFFVPFILLGLWMDMLNEKFKKGKFATAIIFIFLILSNLFVVFSLGKEYYKGMVSSVDTSVLGEIRPMAAYIIENSNGSNPIYFSGRKMYRKRFFKPLAYLVRQENKQMILLDNKEELEKNRSEFFYITKKSSKKFQAGDSFEGKTIINFKVFNSIAIYLLK